jgi:hypothetical protein
VQQSLFLGKRGDWMRRPNEVVHAKKKKKTLGRYRYFALRCATDFDFGREEDVIGGIGRKVNVM